MRPQRYLERPGPGHGPPVVARAWRAALPRHEFGSLTLIYDAASLTTLVPLGRIDAAELSLALRVGLEAPMLPCAAFLDASADPRAFGERTRFARFKTEGRLDSAKAAAAKVVALLERPDYEANPVGDVRDA